MVHKVKIPAAKFKVNEVVVASDNDDWGIGVVKFKEYIWHPEYWGVGKKPYWSYSLKNHPKSLGTDIEGNWKENSLRKVKKSDW